MMLFYLGRFNLIRYNKVDDIIIELTTSYSNWDACYGFMIHFFIFLSKHPNVIIGLKVFYQLYIFFEYDISGIRMLRWAVHLCKTLIDNFIGCPYILRSILTTEHTHIFDILFDEINYLEIITHPEKIERNFPSLFLSVLGISSLLKLFLLCSH